MFTLTVRRTYNIDPSTHQLQCTYTDSDHTTSCLSRLFDAASAEAVLAPLGHAYRLARHPSLQHNPNSIAMAPVRPAKRKSDEAALPGTPQRSPIKRRRIGLTLAHKQALIDNLQLESRCHGSCREAPR